LNNGKKQKYCFAKRRRFDERVLGLLHKLLLHCFDVGGRPRGCAPTVGAPFSVFGQSTEKMMNESDAEEIAPAVARCHAPRKTGRVLNKAVQMRFSYRLLLCRPIGTTYS
jgi:hypothetical protein